MNQEQVNALIGRLADKTLSFGCIAEYEGEVGVLVKTVEGRDTPCFYKYPNDPKYISVEECKTLGHPVTKGRVEKLIAEKLDTANNLEFECLNRLTEFWLPCGLDKSLQQIVQESGWGTREKEFYKVTAIEDKDLFGTLGAGKSFKWEAETVEWYEARHPECFTRKELISSESFEQLKSPEARALFEHLDQLFPTK